jgi:hypothetical protein
MMEYCKERPMSFLFADESLPQKLAEATEPLSICTRDGNVLGVFSPAKPMRIHLDSPLSEEELERRMKVSQGRPLSAILRDLESKA